MSVTQHELSGPAYPGSMPIVETSLAPLRLVPEEVTGNELEHQRVVDAAVFLKGLALVDRLIGYGLTGNAPINGFAKEVIELLADHPCLEIDDVRQTAIEELLRILDKGDGANIDPRSTPRELIRAVRMGFMEQGRLIRIKKAGTAQGDRLAELQMRAYSNRWQGGMSEQLAGLLEHLEYPQTIALPILNNDEQEALNAQAEHPDTTGTTLLAGDGQPFAQYIPVSAVNGIEDAQTDTQDPKERSTDIALAESLTAALLDKLSPVERVVLEKQFGLNGEEILTQKEIANYLGITRQEVSKIKIVAMQKLRNPDASNLGSTTKTTSTLDLLKITDVLPELPVFSTQERWMNISHHEWLNLALLHIYNEWQSAKEAGQDIRLATIIDNLGIQKYRTIIYALSAASELIDARRGSNSKLRVALGSLTLGGVAKVMAHYKDNSRAARVSKKICGLGLKP